MDAEQLGKFNAGNTVSATSERTGYRGVRRLRERFLLRRERLHRVLDLMGFLPPHYAESLTRYGKFANDVEVKLPWCKTQDGTYEFIFMSAFLEMMEDFKQSNPTLIENGKRIPLDWTIYYLRKKGLTQLLSNQELAWLLLHFNQKRGYYQLRGDEEEDGEKKNEDSKYHSLKVDRVEADPDSKGEDIWYNIILENGMVYHRRSKKPLEWEGRTLNLIVTTKLDSEGNPKKKKDGEIDRSFRMPSDDDWTLLKKKTEAEIDQSQKTVGTYIYDTLLANPAQKIKGELVRTIERKYYKNELRQILEKQQELNPTLQNRELYARCIAELYPSNDAHRKHIEQKDFCYLFVEDILFYQRPLKSKKSLIDNCPYEEMTHIDKETGECKVYGVKCIAKSHPLFQEFRLWQFIQNLRIFDAVNDKECTERFISNVEQQVALFEWLNNRKSVTQKDLLAWNGFNIPKKEQKNYRWNYVEDKTYPANETRGLLLEQLKKAETDAAFLTSDMEESLWHILYSIDDKAQLKRTFQNFAQKHDLSEQFVEVFAKTKPFEKSYGSYSAKAIKKLLPLMRVGKYWSAEVIDAATMERIERIIDGEYDENINDRTREKCKSLTSIEQFQNLPLWLACYVVYGRHSEAKDASKWNCPEDIDSYLATFKQHSLRNPVVEKVITETLRVVHDIWKQEGRIDEIHVELGREMKNPADKRKADLDRQRHNEDTNMRIRALLTEFMNPELAIENVRAYSPSQQELLRIYEEGVMGNEAELPQYIKDIQKKFCENDKAKRPTSSDIQRYKAWLDQGYRSPYTGNVIPLSRLFTKDYEIEHIIPQSRYFDDSLTNKVICESAVNKLKDNMLGMEFIRQHHGERVDCGGNKFVTIYSVEEYERNAKEQFAANIKKRDKLLMDEIPDDFIQRQMNDTRYISRVVMALLSNIVREEGEVESTSKNLIVCNGSITTRLKQDWGINEVWNRIILPRFERMNKLKGNSQFTAQNTQGHTIPAVPFELRKGFSFKRIDHRHHAMDAIVIACANRNIVNYLNNCSAVGNASISRQDLQHMLCTKCKQADEKGNYKWVINKPWQTFVEDTYNTLQAIIVSFKQNLRIINKTSNHYLHYDEEEKKVMVSQTKGESWAIRKSMHKDTVYGDVNLRRKREERLSEVLIHPQNVVDKELRNKLQELLLLNYNEKQIKKFFESQGDEWSDFNPNKIEVYYFTHDTDNERYYAVRKSLVEELKGKTSSNIKNVIETITDTGIQKILLRHLEQMGGNPEQAFSPEGIDAMNDNLTELNGGKPHQPIRKVRVFKKGEKRFMLGRRGNKNKKFVEAAKGTNLFFAIYEQEEIDKKTSETHVERSFNTIPLNEVIQRQKQGLASVPANKNGIEARYVLSPNDLVYVPTAEEIKNGVDWSNIDKGRIYKVVSCDTNRCFFILDYVATVIENGKEFNKHNKVERTDEKVTIKQVCIPITVDRLGNIINHG